MKNTQLLMSNCVRSAVHNSFCIGCKIINRIRSSVTSKVTGSPLGSRGQLVGAGLGLSVDHDELLSHDLLLPTPLSV